MAAALQAELHSCLRLLPPQERKLVALRWGLADGRCRTFTEIGRTLKCSGECGCEWV